MTPVSDPSAPSSSESPADGTSPSPSGDTEKQAEEQAKEQAKQRARAAKAARKESRAGVRAQAKAERKARRREEKATRPKWNDAKQFALVARCTHPRLALGLGVAIFAAAMLSGRGAAESVVAGGAVLVLQLLTGLLNDAFDRELDRRSGAPRKPIAEGRVPAGNAAFVATGLFLVLLPMAFQNGTLAGFLILAALLVALLHDRTLHRTPFSVVGWAATGVLLVFFLAYGGWGLGNHGSAPAPGMVLVGGLAGVCLHLATSLTHLPLDHAAGIKPFPLAIALRTGAPKLLLLTAALSAGTLVAFIIGALGPGLHG